MAIAAAVVLTPDGLGLTASDRFRLDRKAWASLKSWRVSGLPPARTEAPRQPSA